VIDYAREDRWAQEIVPSLVVGDAVWLATTARPKVLAILTEPAGAPRGSVIVIHGLGVHPFSPRFRCAGRSCRRGLCDAVGADASARRQPRATTIASSPRSRRAHCRCDRLSAPQASRIALVSQHRRDDDRPYLARPMPRRSVHGPVGMLVDFSALPKEPVLDFIAENELVQVVATAPARARRIPKDGCSRQLTIAGTDHYCENRQKELAAAIAAFLDRVFRGRC
jgi:hypothetical protein